MAKVISQSPLGKYALLELDEELPKTKYTKYMIDGKEYNIVPVSSMKNRIAVTSQDDLMGKTVEFI